MSFLNAQTGKLISTFGKGVEGVGDLINARQEIEVGDFNADVLNQRAQAERKSQALLEQQKRRVIKSQIGTQISLFAKSGVTLSGSPIEVITDSLANAEMDIAIDTFNSEVAARGLEAQGRLAKVTARQRAISSGLKAGRSFISVAADLVETFGKKEKKLGAGITPLR